MEKHRCKLCFRNFANGRALGGHMRSHMMNLYASSKAKQEEEENIDDDHREASEEIESVPSSTSSEDEDEENGDKGLFSYRLSSEISPKKKTGMVDHPEFCFGTVEAAGSSVVVQDGESETESSKNPICRRSKRVRKSRISDTLQFSGYNDDSMKEQQVKKPKSQKQGRFSSELPFVEAEPVSSISDTTPEEDVAYCLMMLSRDKWKRGDNEEVQEQEDVYEEEEEADREEQEKEKKKDRKLYSHEFGMVKATKSRTRGKYRCEACNKVFRSYQALGGHRASHKRIKAQISNSTEEAPPPPPPPAGMEIGYANAAFSSVVEEKRHECPVCYRVFPSGQALGGHKRSHVMGAGAGAGAAAATHGSISLAAKPFSRFGETFIDLNLPAPIDDDDVSQIELSAVSDAEFVNPFKQ